MISIDETGVTADSLEQNLQRIRAEFQKLFGADLSLSPQTPQAQIAGILALAETEIAEAIVEASNIGSVDHAGGSLLDTLGSLLGHWPAAGDALEGHRDPRRCRQHPSCRGLPGQDISR